MVGHVGTICCGIPSINKDFVFAENFCESASRLLFLNNNRVILLAKPASCGTPTDSRNPPQLLKSADQIILSSFLPIKRLEAEKLSLIPEALTGKLLK